MCANRSCGLGILLVAGLLVPVACDRPEPSPPPALDISELVIITPHGAMIREAFADGFRRWQEDNKLPGAITIRWIHKGTLDCQRHVYDRYAQYPESSQRRIGIDVFWGGGIAVHRDVAARGFALPIKLSAKALEGIPAELNGQPLYAPDGSWHGTALGGFGIVFNRSACQARGIPEPATWADLANPAYAGWVAAADPVLSGSTTQCLVLIMLKHGWEEGWGIVTGLLANTNGLLPSSSLISPIVSSGVAMAGLEPEFVARTTIAESPDRMDYINPPAATAITPDPVTVLVGTSALESATQFVEFLLSPQGQSLWALPPDAPGGPPGQPLYRYPIRPEIYQQYKDQLVVRGNPFTEQSDFRIDDRLERAYTILLPLLVDAACGPNHVALQQAWQRARAQGGDSPRLAELLRPPFTLEEALEHAEACAHDPQQALTLQKQWAELFAERYRSGS